MKKKNIDKKVALSIGGLSVLCLGLLFVERFVGKFYVSLCLVICENRQYPEQFILIVIAYCNFHGIVSPFSLWYRTIIQEK